VTFPVSAFIYNPEPPQAAPAKAPAKAPAPAKGGAKED
jgi:hypothetical protein